MEREEDFKNCIQALDEAMGSAKGDLFMWIACAVLMFITGVLTIIFDGWLASVPWFLVVLVEVYVVFLHKRHMTDLQMLRDSAKLIEHMIVSQKEFHDKVEEIFKEAAEAAAKEQESANDVTFEPVK